MQIPVAIRRQAYRGAHRMLRAWWFVRRPVLHGVKCVLTDGDLVLLVRHTYGHRGWDLPGGNLRRGEAPERAAIREMEEELGIHVEHWKALGDILRVSYRRQDTLHCFRAEVHAPVLTLNAAELAAAQWFHREELPGGVGRHVRPVLSRAEVIPPGASERAGAR